MAESKLLLFLSVDVIGSTSYKNSHLADHKRAVHPWLQFFQSFYSGFPVKLRENHKREFPERVSPRLWKGQGDELVFISHIRHVDDILAAVSSFKKTVTDYGWEIQNRLPMDLKATAWLAGLPVINAEVTIPADVSSSDEADKVQIAVTDYIGPSIDIGFRLCKLADSRKFIISVELAYVLAKKMQKTRTSEKFHFFFDSPRELKGVLNNKPYPVLWIDMWDRHPPLELILLGREREPCQAETLISYCEKYIRSVKNPFVMVMPYIPESGYGEMPEEHREAIEQLKRQREYEGSALPPLDDEGRIQQEDIDPYSDIKLKEEFALRNTIIKKLKNLLKTRSKGVSYKILRDSLREQIKPKPLQTQLNELEKEGVISYNRPLRLSTLISVHRNK